MSEMILESNFFWLIIARQGIAFMKKLSTVIKSAPIFLTVLQIAFIGLSVAIVYAQANPFYHSPNRDGGLFMYMGDQILKGKLLYVDIWDNKGPLIFYINALGFFLGRGLRWGIWGVEFISVFFAALFGFKLMKKLWGLFPAIVGTWFWLSGLNELIRGGNFTEDYSMLFNFAAIYVFWVFLQNKERWQYPFIIGITLSFSFFLRANNIGVQLSIILVIIISAILDRSFKQSLKNLLWIGLGSLSVFVLVGLYFQSLGTLEEMVVAGYTYNFFYSSGGTTLDGLPHSFTRGLNLLNYIAVIALLGYIVSLEKLPESIRSNTNTPSTWYLLLIVGWPIEIVFSGLSGRNYPHYYICWLPFIALLSGLIAYTLFPKISERLNKKPLITLFAVIVLIAFTNLSLLNQYKTAFTRLLTNREAGVEFVHPVAKYIRENTDPDETVLVWGFQPFINLMAHRESSTGVLSYPVLIESPYSDELNSRFYQELIEKKPVLIIDMVNPDNDTIPHIDPIRREEQAQRLRRFIPPSNLDQVFDYIHNHYHIETKINDVDIYRLSPADQ